MIPPKILRCLSKCEKIETLHLNKHHENAGQKTSYDENEQMELTEALLQLKGQNLHLAVHRLL